VWSDLALSASLALPATCAFVVDPEVAHVVASSAAGVGEIALLAVDPAQRRRGIAHGLLDVVDEVWRREGVTEAWLEVRADNLGAQSLYAARSWAVAGRRPRYYRDGADALLLRLEVR
jgi:ribosomal-protein-alanine N-acetyltransferase